MRAPDLILPVISRISLICNTDNTIAGQGCSNPTMTFRKIARETRKIVGRQEIDKGKMRGKVVIGIKLKIRI